MLVIPLVIPDNVSAFSVCLRLFANNQTEAFQSIKRADLDLPPFTGFTTIYDPRGPYEPDVERPQNVPAWNDCGLMFICPPFIGRARA